MTNLDAVLLGELQSTEAGAAIDTVIEFSNFMRFSGYGSLDILEQARKQARRLGDMKRVAKSTYTLGQLLLRRSEHARARELFLESLPLFETLGDPRGRARCLQSIGSIALDELDLDKAEDCFERAIPLREQIEDHQGVGNCLHGVGKVALSREQVEKARGYFNRALSGDRNF